MRFTHLALPRSLFKPLRIQRLRNSNHYLGSLNGSELLLLLPQARQVGSAVLSLLGGQESLGVVIFSRAATVTIIKTAWVLCCLQYLANLLQDMLAQWVEWV